MLLLVVASCCCELLLLFSVSMLFIAAVAMALVPRTLGRITFADLLLDKKHRGCEAALHIHDSTLGMDPNHEGLGRKTERGC